uniref:Uncharacterized protein n=1 Tax=Rhizophora mucronata TaxID=61149 RepID=A0A2P2NHS9_RHIMU
MRNNERPFQLNVHDQCTVMISEYPT